MLTEDHLIRMINLAIAALLRIVGLKKSGSYEEALALIDLTFEQLLGLRASMAKNLDDDRLYFLLTRGETLDTRRLAIVADLFHQEADIYAAQGRAQESQADYARALKYTLEVLFNEHPADIGDLHGKVGVLVDSLDLPHLGADVLWPLVGYYEEQGDYAKAEALLVLLAERPALRESIWPELAAFYQRLLARSDAELSDFDLSRADIQRRLRPYLQ